jgi:SNF2 family DNA or RNA helicase
MTSKQQQITLDSFKDDATVKVMLVSTIAGGYDLNLTDANRAILIDLWWNTFQEKQAFGRIHRIGQKKEVHTAKIVATGTVEEDIVRDNDIVELQNEKERRINGVWNSPQ